MRRREPVEVPALRGLQDAFATVARSPSAGFFIGLVALGLAVLTLLFADAVAGAIIIAALVLAFVAVGLYGLIIRDKFGGLYDVLRDESVWDIKEPAGETVLTRTRELRFLQDGVFAVRDYAWGTGDVGNSRDTYECDPGYPADFFDARGRQNVIISLRDSRQRGETETLVVTRRMRGMFPKDSEWITMEPLAPTDYLAFSILFPADRLPQAAWWNENSRPEHNRKRLTPEGTGDGRQKVSVEIPKPALREAYTVWWDW